MSIAWWPALAFGWPGPILAVIFCVVGIARAKVAWLIAAAVVIVPFSLYLGMNPRVQWGVALPLFPLIAAVAISRGSKPIAWLSLLLLTGMILWLASIVFVKGHIACVDRPCDALAVSLRTDRRERSVRVTMPIGRR